MHAFAAKAMRERYPDKESMVNAPLEIMTNLLQSALISKGIEGPIKSVIRDYTFRSNNEIQDVTLKIPSTKEELEAFVMCKTNPKSSWFFDQINLWGMNPTIAINLEQLSSLHEIGEIIHKTFEHADIALQISDLNGSLPKDFVKEFTENTPAWITDKFLPEFKKAQEARKRIICAVTGAVIGGITGCALDYLLCSRTAFPRDIMSAAALCASFTIAGTVLGYFTGDISKERHSPATTDKNLN